MNKYKAWILGALALALVIGAAFLLRGKPGTPAAPLPTALAPTLPGAPVAKGDAPPAMVFPLHSGGSAPLLSALKDALFTLETERLGGKLSEAEYAQLKPALETVLRWALARNTV